MGHKTGDVKQQKLEKPPKYGETVLIFSWGVLFFRCFHVEVYCKTVSRRVGRGHMTAHYDWTEEEVKFIFFTSNQTEK